MNVITSASILNSTLYKIQEDYWVFKVKRKIKKIALGLCPYDYVVYNRLTNKSINFTLPKDEEGSQKMQRIINKAIKILSSQ